MIRKIEGLDLKKRAAPARFEDAADMALVPVSALVVDDDYQRNVKNNGLITIRKMAADFSWHRFGCLIVCSHGKDAFKVIDGQHRAIAAASIGLERVPCIIIREDISTSGEAADFIGINTARTAVHSIDKFRALVAAGDDIAVAVNKALRELGVSLVHNNGNDLAANETRAANALLDITRKHGAGVLFSAIELLMDAWPDERNILNAFSMRFAARLVMRCIEGDDDLNDVVTALQEIDIAALSAEASSVVRMMGGAKIDAAIKIFDRNRKKKRATTI